jgi:hypothetical protein
VGLQHLDDRGQQARALAVGEGAQRGAAAVAGEAEGAVQVEPGGVDPRQFGAEHRIDERRAGAAAGLPAAGDVVGEEFGHWVNLICPSGSR